MKTKLSNSFFWLYILTIVSFSSCNNEDPAPPINLHTITNKVYTADKVFLTLNGDTFNSGIDLTFSYTGDELQMGEVCESRMLLETAPPWAGADGNLYEVANVKFDVNVSSSPKEVSFTGQTRNDAVYYEMDVQGTIRNDSVWLDMSYRTMNNNMKDKTFELQMSADSYLLDFLRENVKDYQDTVIWEGTTYQTVDFIRESLAPIFNEYVQKTGIDAYRLTFLEDGRIDVMARQANNGTYIPIEGDFAYRFHKGYGYGGGGVFEIGTDEAQQFCSDFQNDNGLPNFLFHTVDWAKKKAYIPVELKIARYRVGDWDDIEERLTLELVGYRDYSAQWYNYSYFLNAFTKYGDDFSDKTMRLRKISSMVWGKRVSDQFLFYMKEVK